ncbi:uncharacterized protein LOC144147012 [Haemaphysalis longicornis]
MAVTVYLRLLICLIEMQVLLTGQIMFLSPAVSAMSLPYGGNQLMAQQATGYGLLQSPAVPVPTITGIGLATNPIGIPVVTGMNVGIPAVVAVPMVPVGPIAPSSSNPTVSNAAAAPQAVPPPAAAQAVPPPEPAAPEAADEAARNDELSSNAMAAQGKQLAAIAPHAITPRSSSDPCSKGSNAFNCG